MFALVRTGPEPEKKIAEPLVPPVETLTVRASSHTLVVEGEGTVAAAIASVLVPEVSGRIVGVGASFDAGRFVEEGEVLLTIDPLTYESALAEAESRLAAARLSLAQEQAQGAQAAEEWEQLGRGEPSELTLRQPQQVRARAEIAAAEAAVALARRNLARTEVRAPYRGRVRETFVDLGQVVMANTSQLAALYAIDAVEVRLPLSLAELDRLGLEESYRGSEVGGPRAPVRLTARFGSRVYAWDGYIDRIEGTIDPATRVARAVAVVEDPYGRDETAPERPPLKVGLFVEAAIEGRRLEEVFVLPRRAMVREDTLYVVDAEDRLHRREVEVVAGDDAEVVIRAGLRDGERVNLTPIDFFIEGMPVRPQPLERGARETDAPAEDGA